VATSTATSHKSAVAPVPVTSAAPATGSVAGSGGPRSASPISRPGSSTRRPPLPPGRPPPRSVPPGAPKRSTQVGVKAVSKVGAKASAKTGAKAVSEEGDQTSAKTGTKPSAKAAAKTGATAVSEEGDQTSAKTGAKTIVKAAAKTGAKAVSEEGDQTSAKTGAKTIVKKAANTSAKQIATGRAGQTPVGASVVHALPTTGDGVYPAAAAPPPSGGPRARRERSAFGLAADALRRSTRSGKRPALATPAAVLPVKRPATGVAAASAAPALKRSRRLVGREQRLSAAQRQASATMTAAEELSLTTAAPKM